MQACASCRRSHVKPKVKSGSTRSTTKTASRTSRPTLSSMLLPVVELCNAAATVSVIAYGGWLMVNGGEVTLGVLVAFLAYITRFFQPIRTLTQFYNQLQAATAATEKVFELLDEPVTIREAPDAAKLSHVRG